MSSRAAWIITGAAVLLMAVAILYAEMRWATHECPEPPANDCPRILIWDSNDGPPPTLDEKCDIKYPAKITCWPTDRIDEICRMRAKNAKGGPADVFMDGGSCSCTCQGGGVAVHCCTDPGGIQDGPDGFPGVVPYAAWCRPPHRVADNVVVVVERVEAERERLRRMSIDPADWPVHRDFSTMTGADTEPTISCVLWGLGCPADDGVDDSEGVDSRRLPGL